VASAQYKNMGKSMEFPMGKSGKKHEITIKNMKNTLW
jgi:hypothetical protein